MICECVRGAEASRTAKEGSAGVAYVAVLILILLITVSGLAFVQLGEMEDRLFMEEARLSQALWAAEGAARRVRVDIAGLGRVELEATPDARLYLARNPDAPEVTPR